MLAWAVLVAMPVYGANPPVALLPVVVEYSVEGFAVWFMLARAGRVLALLKTP